MWHCPFKAWYTWKIYIKSEVKKTEFSYATVLLRVSDLWFCFRILKYGPISHIVCTKEFWKTMLLSLTSVMYWLCWVCIYIYILLKRHITRGWKWYQSIGLPLSIWRSLFLPIFIQSPSCFLLKNCPASYNTMICILFINYTRCLNFFYHQYNSLFSVNRIHKLYMVNIIVSLYYMTLGSLSKKQDGGWIKIVKTMLC